jgi:plastocyanin
MHILRPNRRRLLTLSSLALVLAASTAIAAPVKGKIDLPKVAPDLTDTPHHVRAKNGFIPTVERVHDPSAEVTIAISGDDATRVACEARLENGQLVPRTLVGAPGTSIVIANHDATEYRLAADGVTGLSGASIGPGHAATATLGEAGAYEIVDALHPHVRGHVVVLPGLVGCAEVNDAGAFRFEQVEPGNYQAHYFVDGQERATQPLTVPPPGSGTVSLPPISLAGAR